MSVRTLQLSDALQDYLVQATLRETDVMRRLRDETARLPMARMQISPEQGQFMTLLVEMLGARRAIEVGAFTGYSALCVASVLPPGGKLVTCDVSEEWTAVAQRYWREAGVADRIDLRLGRAAGTLEALLADPREHGAYDFMFIDADKGEYDRYYEQGLMLLRRGGLIAVDNALWSGRVADSGVQDDDTRALRALNAKVRDDPRVSMSLVPIGDGLLLARKR